jgi:hypothetical protein
MLSKIHHYNHYYQSAVSSQSGLLHFQGAIVGVQNGTASKKPRTGCVSKANHSDHA